MIVPAQVLFAVIILPGAHCRQPVESQIEQLALHAEATGGVAEDIIQPLAGGSIHVDASPEVQVLQPEHAAHVPAA